MFLLIFDTPQNEFLFRVWIAFYNVMISTDDSCYRQKWCVKYFLLSGTLGNKWFDDSLKNHLDREIVYVIEYLIHSSFDSLLEMTKIIVLYGEFWNIKSVNVSNWDIIRTNKLVSYQKYLWRDYYLKLHVSCCKGDKYRGKCKRAKLDFIPAKKILNWPWLPSRNHYLKIGDSCALGKTG